MHHNRKLMMSSCLTAVLAAGAIASPATAQDVEDQIIVTATKRATTLQDIPIAVSVVGEQEIARAEIQDLLDLQSVVPSLQVTQINLSNATNFIIRGFGNGANNAGIEPSVGVFIDGVYRSRSAAALSDLPNIERVEVLRGPQSTLFGKNASAGVVSIVTQAPEFEFGGSVEATYGNYDAIRLSGDITGPISESVAYSLFGSYNRRDGFVEDLGTGDDINNRNRFALRGQLLVEPNENLSVRIIGDYDQFDELCCGAANLVNGPTGAAVFALGGAIDPENPFSRQVFNNSETANENEVYGISGQVDYDFGFATGTSITAYRKTDNENVQDVDYTSLDLLNPNPNTSELDTFTQEFRLTSNPSDSRFDWMVGAYYFNEDVRITDEVTWGSQARGYIDILLGAAGASSGVLEAAFGLPNGTFFQQGQGLTEASGQDNESWSVFGTVDFAATDRLTLTAGLNYTEDRKDVFHNIQTTDVYSQIDFSPLVPLFGPAAVAGLQGLQVFPQFLDFPNAVENGRSKDDDLTYTLRAAFDATDNLNVYASYATGFKATSWNLSRDSRPFISDFPAITAAGLLSTNLASGTRFAGPESAEVFEIGIKGRFDNFRFSLDVFDQTIEDFQSFVFLGTGFGLANAGEQSTQGLEIETTWQPTDALTLNFAGTFLDPKFDSFPDSSFGDLSGETPAQFAKTNISIGGNYDFEIGGRDAYIRGDYQYQSSSAFEDDPVLDAQVGALFSNAVNLVNMSAGIELADDLDLSVWSRNLFDDEFVVFAFPSVVQAGSYSGFANDPRTYGVTLRKGF
ncbi:MAG: TonB-dependent receptor [Pseudomonadota bacterium]